MDEHDVPLLARLLEGLGRNAIVLFKDRPVFDAKLVLGALQGVVEALGDVKEGLRPEHDVPLGLEAHIPHQRHERVQDLRDPSAEARRADMQNPPPPQALPEGHYLIVEFPAHDAAVIGERLVAGVYTLLHSSTFYFLLSLYCDHIDYRLTVY